MKHDWPPNTRVFAQLHEPFGYWVFGPVTRASTGDYYNERDSRAHVAPSIYTLEQILCHREAKEVVWLDPDLQMDEGL